MAHQKSPQHKTRESVNHKLHHGFEGRRKLRFALESRLGKASPRRHSRAAPDIKLHHNKASRKISLSLDLPNILNHYPVIIIIEKRHSHTLTLWAPIAGIH